MKSEIREDLAMDLDVVEQMIKESGRMWLETRDRSEMGTGPIIVTESPDRAVYLERRDNYQGDLSHIDGWVLVEQPLFAHDAASFYPGLWFGVAVVATRSCGGKRQTAQGPCIDKERTQ